MKRLFAAVLCALLVSGCAGRDANPVSMVQGRDQSMNCDQIQQEIALNRGAAVQLLSESDNNTTKNWVVGGAGLLLFPPLLFALDLKDGEKAEARALESRNTYLQTLAVKRCGQRPYSG